MSSDWTFQTVTEHLNLEQHSNFGAGNIIQTSKQMQVSKEQNHTKQQTCYAYCKNRLAVSTAEWLHDLLYSSTANCIQQSVSLLFPH